jgi:hypothetical protein
MCVFKIINSVIINNILITHKKRLQSHQNYFEESCFASASMSLHAYLEISTTINQHSIMKSISYQAIMVGI